MPKPIEEITYNVETGKIFRTKADGSIVEVGNDNGNGYLLFGFKGKMVSNHRYLMSKHLNRELLATEIIDHINFDTKDNRISNLRIVTSAQNQQHSRKRSNNTSGYKHISWYKERQKWLFRIVEGEKILVQKYFTELEDAIQYRDEKITELNNSGKHFHIPDNEKSHCIINTIMNIQKGNHNY